MDKRLLHWKVWTYQKRSTLSNDKLWHALKGHPNLTKSDFEKIADIVKNWDSLTVKNKTIKKFYRVVYKKQYAEKTYVYIEQLRPSRNADRSYFVSLYII